MYEKKERNKRDKEKKRAKKEINLEENRRNLGEGNYNIFINHQSVNNKLDLRPLYRLEIILLE